MTKNDAFFLPAEKIVNLALFFCRPEGGKMQEGDGSTPFLGRNNALSVLLCPALPSYNSEQYICRKSVYPRRMDNATVVAERT